MSSPITEAKESIAIVTVWYGPLPPWWRLTVLTMARNADVDFFVIGDFPRPAGSLPPNVTLCPVSWKQFRRRVKQRLGIRMWGGVRKLCDLKPAFGDLFADRLEGHDWWAWADLDVVYGDIRGSLAPLGMDQLDAISTYALHASSGPLMFVRNDERGRRLYRESPDWKRALRRRPYVAFDEWWGEQGYVDFPEVVGREVSRGLRIARKQLMADNRSYNGNDEVIGFSGRRCTWNDGVVTAIDDRQGLTFEVLYFHFIDWKRKEYYAQLDALGDRCLEIASFDFSETDLDYSLSVSPGSTGSQSA